MVEFSFVLHMQTTAHNSHSSPARRQRWQWLQHDYRRRKRRRKNANKHIWKTKKIGIVCSIFWVGDGFGAEIDDKTFASKFQRVCPFLPTKVLHNNNSSRLNEQSQRKIYIKNETHRSRENDSCLAAAKLISLSSRPPSFVELQFYEVRTRLKRTDLPIVSTIYSWMRQYSKWSTSVFLSACPRSITVLILIPRSNTSWRWQTENNFPKLLICLNATCTRLSFEKMFWPGPNRIIAH